MSNARRPGVSMVILDNAGRVLLVQREDFRLWQLPGGGCHADEKPEEAAVREVEEETGYRVVVDRLVGYYFNQHSSHEVRLFEGRVVGGQPVHRGRETWALGWFPPDARPWPFMGRDALRIEDALADYPQPVVRHVDVPLATRLFFKVAIPLRNLRNRFFRRPES